MFVPLDKKEELSKKLKNLRCQGRRLSFSWDFPDCPYCGNCKEEYHTLNNSEIHFQNIDSSKSKAVKDISKSWLKFLLNNCKRNKKLFYFKIDYIELNKMNMEHFGFEQAVESVYNRFFRSNILGGSKYFFNRNYNKIVINNIYHDRSDSKENHEYFPWHTGYKINADHHKKVSVSNKDIIFLDSDHKYYFDKKPDFRYESQFIQLIDLILGTVRQNIYYSSKDSFKNEISMIIRPLLKTLLENEKNSYSHRYRRYSSISFFPKTSVMDKEKLFIENYLEDTKGRYYNSKKIQMPEFAVKQTSLDYFKP